MTRTTSTMSRVLLLMTVLGCSGAGKGSPPSTGQTNQTGQPEVSHGGGRTAEGAPGQGEATGGNEPTATAGPPRTYGPVVAGMFYPADPKVLGAMIDRFIDQAPPHDLPTPLLGFMVPHAGYRFSGRAAGHAYRAIRGLAPRPGLVVVMAPSHHVPAPYAATLDVDQYQTPLGRVTMAKDLATRLASRSQVVEVDERLFTREHAMEVHLPFLRKALPGVPVLPLVIGTRDPGVLHRLSRDLGQLLQGRSDVLFVASSDMSHYLTYDQCNEADQRTFDVLLQRDPDRLLAALRTREAQLCGGAAVAVLLDLLRARHGEDVRVLFHENSGDTAGDRSRVVGYGVVAFGGGDPAFPKSGGAGSEEHAYDLTIEEKRLLLKLARDTVETWVRERRLPDFTPPPGVLAEPGAAFVTLKEHGRLRGCIGYTQAIMPLWKCVREVAASAATRDTRFPPVTPEELHELDYEVSVLTPLTPLPNPLDVRVGTDGLMVRWRGRRGLLLPQVPGEFGWSKEEFLAHTCRKAGLPVDCWKRGARFERFQALVFDERSVGPRGPSGSSDTAEASRR